MWDLILACLLLIFLTYTSRTQPRSPIDLFLIVLIAFFVTKNRTICLFCEHQIIEVSCRIPQATGSVFESSTWTNRSNTERNKGESIRQVRRHNRQFYQLNWSGSIIVWLARAAVASLSESQVHCFIVSDCTFLNKFCSITADSWQLQIESMWPLPIPEWL